MINNESWIDSLKGIAIIGVLASHINPEQLNETVQKIVFSGARGVQIFFVISSFLAYQSLNRYYRGTKESLLSWYGKKLKRLLPLYYLFLIYTLVREIRIGLGREYLIDFGIHILLINAFFPRYINSLLGVEWYLADIILFFVIAPLLFKIINSVEKAIICWGGSIVIIAVLNNVILYLVDLSNYNLVSYLSNFSIITQLPAILLGIVLYYCYDRIRDLKIKNKTAVSILLMILSVDLFVSLVMGSRIIGYSTTGLYSLAVFGVIIAVNNSSFAIIDNKVFAFLGKHSYGIYLFQTLFLRYVNKISIPINKYLLFVLKLLVLITLSLFCSLAWQKVEDFFVKISLKNKKSIQL